MADQNAKDLAQKIIDEINILKTEKGDNFKPSDAMQGFYNGLKNYVENYMKITFTWTAAMVNPPYTTDPVTSYEAEIKLLLNILGNSMIDQPIAALVDFQTQLQNQLTIITNAVVNAKTTGINIDTGEIETIIPPFIVSPTTLLANGSIILSAGNKEAKNQQEAMENVSQNIIDGLKLMINITPVTGTHGTYTGTGIMSTIEFS